VRVALWTPTLSGWATALAAELERELDLTLVRAEPRERPAAELDL
jgi:hypothetical protein